MLLFCFTYSLYQLLTSCCEYACGNLSRLQYNHLIVFELGKLIHFCGVGHYDGRSGGIFRWHSLLVIAIVSAGGKKVQGAKYYGRDSGFVQHGN